MSQILGVQDRPILPIESEAVTPFYRRFVLTMSCIAIAFSYLDRQVIGMVLQPVKLEMHLSDKQLGLLSGVAFALFYATLGIPIARLADRTSRRNVLAVCLGAWSIMTMLCGSTVTFWQFLLARVGVGVGEAGCNPTLYSMLADYFPKDKRPPVYGYLAMATQAGILVALALGGYSVAHFGWRTTFVIAGSPGIVFALIWALTIKEPIRGIQEGHTAPQAAEPFRRIVGWLWRNRTYRNLVFATCASGFVSFGVGTWVPSFLIRSYGMRPQAIGLTLALSSGVLACVGAVAGGYLASYLTQRDQRWYFWQPTITTIIAGTTLCGAFLSPIPVVTLTLYALTTGIIALSIGAYFSMTQALVPANFRSTASACWLLLFNFVGVGFGQQYIGILSDAFAPAAGKESLRYALLATAVFYFISSWFFFRSAATMKDDIAAAEAA